MPKGRGHKLPVSECQRRISKISPNIKIVEYISAAIPAKCFCKICGNKWDEPTKNLYRGSNCPNCFKRKNNTRTLESFKKEMLFINANIIIKSGNPRSRNYMFCECRQCGHQWSAKTNNLLSGKGCPSCARRSLPQHRVKSQEQFEMDVAQIHPSIIVKGAYVGARRAVECECSVCSCMWSPTPNNLLSGGGCPSCGEERARKKTTKPHLVFVDELFEISPNIVVEGQYMGAHCDVELRCRVCDNTWSATPDNLLRQATGCPLCVSSHGEKAIAAHLSEKQIDYIPQYEFDDLLGVGGGKLSFDFYLPFLDVLIEYQGEYHDGTVPWQTYDQLLKQKEHDRRKKEYALKREIKLIEIWYYDFKSIKKILDKELTTASAPVAV